MRFRDWELDMILRALIMARGDEGATISELRSDYYEITGEYWPLRFWDTERIVKYIWHIDGVMMERFDDDGLCLYYIDDIGVSVTEQYDSNNNIIVIEDTVVSTDNEQNEHNHSYAIQRPRVWQPNGQTSSSSDTLLIEPIEQNKSRKRNLSGEIQPTHQEKRQCVSSPDRIPLIEKNLDIHNRCNGTDLRMKHKTTSTEIENSMHADLNGCMVTNEYIEPISNDTSKTLQRAFKKHCQINEKPSFIQTESAISDNSTGTIQVFPPTVGVIADDFMRSLFSYELYGGDFTNDEHDPKYTYSFSGQTIGEACRLVQDKPYQFAINYRYLIVNIGAIDILMGRSVYDIFADYMRLIKSIVSIGVRPIITTIPNIWVDQKNPNRKMIYQSLLIINAHITRCFSDSYYFIDLHQEFVEPNDKFPGKYYMRQAKTIFKDELEMKLHCWTQMGRGQVLDAIDHFFQHL